MNVKGHGLREPSEPRLFAARSSGIGERKSICAITEPTAGAMWFARSEPGIGGG
jgi:hypothetical protein